MEHTDLIAEMMVAEGGIITPTTWNSADKTSDMALSNGDLTVTHSGTSWGYVKAVASSSTAKWYMEIYNHGDLTQATLNGFIASDGDPTVPNAVGAKQLVMFANGMDLYWNGSLVASNIAPNPSTYETQRFAIDIPNHKIWVGDEDGWYNSGDPGAGINPSYSGFPTGTFYAICQISANGIINTADFGQAPAYTVPDGFTSVG